MIATRCRFEVLNPDLGLHPEHPQFLRHESASDASTHAISATHFRTKVSMMSMTQSGMA